MHLQPWPDAVALERILDELPAKPFLVGERGFSMLLAGVWEKLPVFVDEDRVISIPVDGTPSKHILKPDAKGWRVVSRTKPFAWAECSGWRLSARIDKRVTQELRADVEIQ